MAATNVRNAPATPPSLPLALRVSRPPKVMQPPRALAGERFDEVLQVRVDRDGVPVIHSPLYLASSTMPSTQLQPGDMWTSDVAGVPGGVL
ncbi:hypothetical protein [Streptomyces sp. NPDC059783]|uniref:hypothetical protein n=1 Tax=Streptomyces sp. NPDC059783 TaxID=3346944 RepID=UPI0036475363